MKFVILAHARSGSTLLMTALGQHPQVQMFAELFNPNEVVRYNAFQGGQPGLFRASEYMRRHPQGTLEGYQQEIACRPDRYHDTSDGAEFLQNEVFIAHEVDPTFAVGFKLFYDHARNTSQAQNVWEYLARDREVHVIHLQRANLLETYLSGQIADLTGQWSLQQASREAPAAITLDLMDCRRYFDTMMGQRQEATRLFQHHPTFLVQYEADLLGRFSHTMAAIQQFLQLPVQVLPPQTEKIAQRSPYEQIANYDELRRFFAGSPYAVFFECEATHACMAS